MKDTGVKLADGTRLKARMTLLALGRIGAQWTGEIIDRYGIKARCGKWNPRRAGISFALTEKNE